MPFVPPNQQCQSTEGKSNEGTGIKSIKIYQGKENYDPKKWHIFVVGWLAGV